ncbi:Unknown protein sequence [Pseudomonas amygdali pv. myricae]|nr:Unknown protein sequence [Pseudomonas amygdali pv. myricae]
MKKPCTEFVKRPNWKTLSLGRRQKNMAEYCNPQQRQNLMPSLV